MGYYLPAKYREIEDMLICYYSDEDVITDDHERELAAEFASVSRKVAKVVEQGEELLAVEVFPWDEIGNTANRFFETPEEARVWLELVIDQIKKTVTDCS